MSKYPYEVMKERKDALERLDIHIRWGHYEIRVLRFHFTSFEPKRVINFHKHHEFEFHFIPRGKGKVILIDQSFDLSEGDLYVTGPGVLHYQEAHTHQAMDELCLHIDIFQIEPPGTQEQHPSIQWEVAEAEHCITQLKKIPLYPTKDLFDAMPCFLESYLACQDHQMGTYTTIKQNIIQILLRTVKAYRNGKLQLDLPSRDMKEYRYRFAMQYVQTNYANDISIEDLAEKLHISSRHLQRIIKEKHGNQSFHRILEDIRLEAVCRRLQANQFTIEKIATMEGFSNANYLHTVFRKRYGMTPTAFRKLRHPLKQQA